MKGASPDDVLIFSIVPPPWARPSRSLQSSLGMDAALTVGAAVATARSPLVAVSSRSVRSYDTTGASPMSYLRRRPTLMRGRG
jgi:hypothetical protein